MLLFQYFLTFFSFFTLFVFCVFGYEVDMVLWSSILIITLSFWMVLKSRHNLLMFVLTVIIFYFNYSAIYACYLNPIEGNMYTQQITHKSYVISLNILASFTALIFLMVRWSRMIELFDTNIFIDKAKSNKYIIYTLCIILTLIFFAGFTIPELGERGSGSPLYEYSILLFVLMFYYSGGNKRYIRLACILIVFFSLQGFIFGGRVEGIQLLLCAYLMAFIDKIKKRTLFILMGFAFVLLSVIGVARGNLLTGDFEFESVITGLIKAGVASDTAYSAYYASEAIVYMLDKMTSQQWFSLTVGYIQSIFIGSNLNLELSPVSADYVPHTGGGWLPFYFYFYFRGIGVFMSALYVSFFMNIIAKLDNKSSSFLKLVSVLFVSRVFRWYLYSPSPLLRGMIIFSVVYALFAYYNNYLKKIGLV